MLTNLDNIGMKHLKKGRKFGRKKDQRKALLRGLARNLFIRKKIKTTLAKAKELKSFTEKIISEAKSGSLSSRRRVLALVGRDATLHLFLEIAPKMKERGGGYTRVIHLGKRTSDSAEEAIIELVN